MNDFSAGTTAIDAVGWVRHHPGEPYAALQGDHSASVAIIGAGFAGSSVALRLAQRGVDVVVLEAEQPGFGASGRNAGHVQPFLHTLEPAAQWPDKGQRLLDLVIENKHLIYELCRKHNIGADAVEGGMVEAGVRRYGELAATAKRWAGHGYDVTEVGGTELKRLLGTDRYSYGLHWAEGGRVNPYQLNQGLARAAAEAGARLYGDSRVTACDPEGSQWRVRTSGGSVLADQVIVCTNGHAGSTFFPELAKTQYPLVACAVATTPLPEEIAAQVVPSQAAFVQFPAGLFPMVIDEHRRIISATIPRPLQTSHAHRHFKDLRAYLHATWPVTEAANLQLESYWTGMTANSSSVYHSDYPQLLRVAPGVLALTNLGTWGVFLGPLLGLNLGEALANDDLDEFVMPAQTPQPVKFPGLFAAKIRYGALPLARLAHRTGRI